VLMGVLSRMVMKVVRKCIYFMLIYCVSLSQTVYSHNNIWLSIGSSGNISRRWFTLPSRIDVFGFHMIPKHVALLLLFISLTMGTVGLGLFVFCLSAYNIYQRQSSSSSGSGGGGSSRWKDGKALGANIKGVGDLPKPKSGG